MKGEEEEEEDMKGEEEDMRGEEEVSRWPLSTETKQEGIRRTGRELEELKDESRAARKHKRSA